MSQLRFTNKDTKPVVANLNTLRVCSCANRFETLFAERS